MSVNSSAIFEAEKILSSSAPCSLTHGHGQRVHRLQIFDLWRSVQAFDKKDSSEKDSPIFLFVQCFFKSFNY